MVFIYVYGVSGGVEFGFFSTSVNRAAALQYAVTQQRQGIAATACPTVFEMAQVPQHYPNTHIIHCNEEKGQHVQRLGAHYA